MLGKESITRLASLARLELDDAEAESLRRDMESIIELMDSLQSVEMDGADAFGGEAAALGALRADEVLREIEPSLFLEQAPGADKDGFVIPRMME
jgi:aspartyl-tRNA(Asn)/glutamyl-tRNA(Gln) amidotransferase subunit C